jgi:hypothetical protein
LVDALISTDHDDQASKQRELLPVSPPPGDVPDSLEYDFAWEYDATQSPRCPPASYQRHSHGIIAASVIQTTLPMEY